MFFHFEVFRNTKFGSKGGSSWLISTIFDAAYGIVEMSLISCLIISFATSAMSSMCLAKIPT